MESDLPDETLMQRVTRDDAAAFDLLFLRHRRAVFSYTLRMVEDGSAAEDLTQECFLRVWRARNRYLSTAAFRTWLFTIARRLALDELKRRQTHPTATLLIGAGLPSDSGDDGGPDGTVEPAAADGANPQEIVMARELARVLDRALGDLPLELREVAILRDVEDLSYKEIARVLDCPLGTVKSRLSVARMRLRAVVREWLGEMTT